MLLQIAKNCTKAARVPRKRGGRTAEMRAEDSLLFDATALHGIEVIRTQPVSYLSVVFTLRE
jgi:hypothetical protein